MNIEVSNGDRLAIGQYFLDVTTKEEKLWDKDIRGELATHSNPTNPSVWWKRRLDQIDVLTIHHTLSDSPHVTFQNYVRVKKRPTGPYTFWTTQTGEVLLCVDPELGIWHDHTGFWVRQGGRKLWGNSHLSVGMAGRLHEYIPADVQLERTAKFVADVIKGDVFPSINGIKCIKGHMDVGTYKGRTECPGWASAKSGHWRKLLYNRIEEELNE